jgi:hypothetical protein
MKTQKPDFTDSTFRFGVPLKIVAGAGIASRGKLGGRLIPHVILDTSERPEVEELCRIHCAFDTPGDFHHQWGQIVGKKETVVLCLSFIRPVEMLLAIEFNLNGQGVLVDQAIKGRALYLQAGRPGDRLKHDLSRPKILVEIVETGFSEIWERIYFEQGVKKFRVKGLGRSESRDAAKKFIQELRKLGGNLMSDITNSSGE